MSFTSLFFNHRKKIFFRYLSLAVCVYVRVCVSVCLCDYSHTGQPITLKLWNNIPYVNI